MKKIIAFLTILFVLGFVKPSQASHFAAADLWYEYVSPLKYRVHVGCYLDCQTGNATYNFSNICWWTPSGCGVPGNVSITFADTVGTNDPNNGQILDQLCGGVQNYCVNTSSIYPAFKYTHFAKEITLSNVCADWRFGVSDGARNSTIANGFANGTISIYAELNNVVRAINSSPRYTVLPIPYVCLNNPTVYQNSPQDPDLDSLFTTPNTPLGGSCQNPTPLLFSAPNTVNSPFPNTGFAVNSSTGSASFVPTANGIYVFGFQTSEYDKTTGAKVGSIIRDVQIVVIPCTTPPPVVIDTTLINPSGFIDTIIGGQHEMTVCPGTTLSFTVKGKTGPGAFGHLLTTYADLSSLSSSASYSQTPTPAQDSVFGTFSWTPTALDYGNHVVVLQIVDSTCQAGVQPIVLKSYFTFLIKVLPGVSAGGPYNYCPGSDSLQLTASGPFNPANNTIWTWTTLPGGGNPNFTATNIANPKAAPSAQVDVVVEMLPIITGCPNKDTVTLNVFPSLVVSAGPDKAVCANDAVTLNGSHNRTPGSIPASQISWSPATFLSASNVLQPVCTPLTNNTYVLKIKDNFGCKGTDTVEVNLLGTRPIIGAYAERDTICAGEQVKLYANASPQPCGISANGCTGTVGYQTVGTGNFINSVYSPFYRDFYTDYRAQYLFRADELKAAGLTPGNIKGLSLPVQSAPSNGGTDSLLGFTIKMGCTPLIDLNTTAGFAPGLTTVFSAPKYGPTLGANNINFTNANTYYWDGKSNLIVEFCYNLAQFSSALPCPVLSSPTSFNSALVDQGSLGGGCYLPGNATSFNAAAGSVRPNMKFLFCKSNTFTYAWSPANAFVSPTDENAVLKPGVANSAVNTYTVTVISGVNGVCNATKSLNLVVDGSGGVNASANPNHLCEQGLTTLNATPTAGTIPPQYVCGEENYQTNGAAVLTTVGTGAVTNGAPLSSISATKSQILYLASDLIAAGVQKGRIDAIAFNLPSKSSINGFPSFNVSMSCTKDITLSGFTNIGQGTQVYQNNSFNTVTGWNTINLQTPFLWNGVSNLVVEICYTGYSGGGTDYLQSTSVLYSAVYSEYTNNSDGCSIPLGGASYNNFYNSSTYRPDTRFTITPVLNKPFQYVWTPPLYVYDTTKAQTLAYVLNNKTYTVALVNRTGCLIKDTVQVRIELHDVMLTPSDTQICGGDKVQLIATGSGTGTVPTYVWTPTTNLLQLKDTTVIVNPAATTLYSVIRTDEFGCKDTATSNVKVLSSPLVTILNTGDTLNVPYSNTVNLVAGGADVYSWTPIWASSNSTTNNILLTPLEDGMYYVYGIDTNGCKSYDSVWVRVITTNNLFVPTAFSPNGDDLNDVFKIRNYKFEKIQEFRVFNRFGEEVFNGRNNEGWDGSYKGEKLNMDTYNYLIKVAYPDGSIKVLKGDVLLLR